MADGNAELIRSNSTSSSCGVGIEDMPEEEGGPTGWLRMDSASSRCRLTHIVSNSLASFSAFSPLGTAHISSFSSGASYPLTNRGESQEKKSFDRLVALSSGFEDSWVYCKEERFLFLPAPLILVNGEVVWIEKR